MATKEKTPNSSPFMGRWPAKPAGGARGPCFSELLPIHGEVAGKAQLLPIHGEVAGEAQLLPIYGEVAGEAGRWGPKVVLQRTPPHSWGGGRRSRPEGPEGRASVELLPIHGEVAGEAGRRGRRGRRGPRAVLESAAPSPACGGDFPASGEELQRRKAGPKPRIPPHSWGGG